jgi:exodeoxyribonuclease VII large subunit
VSPDSTVPHSAVPDSAVPDITAPDITVSDLASRLRLVLHREFRKPLWVTGELSSFRRVGNRLYMDIVERPAPFAPPTASLALVAHADATATLRSKLKAASLKLEEGQQLRLFCRVGMYVPSGSLQLEVLDIDPSYTLRKSALSREEMVSRLRRDGLIGLQGKTHTLPIPALRIALLTSSGSHAQADFVSQLAASRFAFDVETLPVLVQGSGAPASVMARLDEVDRHRVSGAPRPFDVVCLIRGGGSRSDLAAWDDMDLARRIAEFSLPVLTGVGHELDRSIADEVAFFSAKTPTACAQFLIDEAAALEERLMDVFQRVSHNVSSRLSTETSRMDSSLSRVALSVSRRVSAETNALEGVPLRVQRIVVQRTGSLLASLDPIPSRVAMLARRRLSSEFSVLSASERSVAALSPSGTLKRGFALVRTASGALVTSPLDAPPGTLLDISLASDTLVAEVKSAP